MLAEGVSGHPKDEQVATGSGGERQLPQVAETWGLGQKVRDSVGCDRH